MSVKTEKEKRKKKKKKIQTHHLPKIRHISNKHRHLGHFGQFTPCGFENIHQSLNTCRRLLGDTARHERTVCSGGDLARDENESRCVDGLGLVDG